MKTIRRSSEDVYDESLRFLTEPFRSPYRRSLYGPRPLGPEEIDGFLVPPGKAFTLLTTSYYWLTLHDEPAEEKWFQVIAVVALLYGYISSTCWMFWVKVPEIETTSRPDLSR